MVRVPDRRPTRVFVNGREIPGVTEIEMRTETEEVVDPATGLPAGPFVEYQPGQRSLHISTEPAVLGAAIAEPVYDVSCGECAWTYVGGDEGDRMLALLRHAGEAHSPGRSRPTPMPCTVCGALRCAMGQAVCEGCRVTHAFEQDQEQAPARLCRHCDMWPEHHNHGRVGACVCQECKPDAEDYGWADTDEGVQLCPGDYEEGL